MLISRKIWMTEKFLNFHTVYPALMQKIANPKQEMRREVPRKIGIWWRTWFCFFEIVISLQSTKVGKNCAQILTELFTRRDFRMQSAVKILSF